MVISRCPIRDKADHPDYKPLKLGEKLKSEITFLDSKFVDQFINVNMLSLDSEKKEGHDNAIETVLFACHDE